MTTKSVNFQGIPHPVDRAGNDGERGLNDRVKWVLIDPPPEEVAELVHGSRRWLSFQRKR